ncbi:MAG TPA: ferredoxin [Microthrixaceae bacterium]|nr:ferredoxin [Microthrixaceae bacterium]
MRIELHAEMCTGHGRCYALAPEIFDADDDGHCVVRVAGDVPPEHEAKARQGVSNCPEGALAVVD